MHCVPTGNVRSLPNTRCGGAVAKPPPRDRHVRVLTVPDSQTPLGRQSAFHATSAPSTTRTANKRASSANPATTQGRRDKGHARCASPGPTGPTLGLFNAQSAHLELRPASTGKPCARTAVQAPSPMPLAASTASHAPSRRKPVLVQATAHPVLAARCSPVVRETVSRASKAATAGFRASTSPPSATDAHQRRTVTAAMPWSRARAGGDPRISRPCSTNAFVPSHAPDGRPTSSQAPR